MTRPMGVTISAALIGLSIFLRIFLSFGLPVPANMTLSNHVDLLSGWAFIILQVLVIYLYWNARNWARMVVLIYSGWFLLGLITLSLLPVPDWIRQAMWGHRLFFVTVGDSLMAIYLLWYLNTRAVRSWYARRPVLSQREPVSN
jgi:hypothetical protein